MRCQWIVQREAPRLILFFNGWGMDPHPFQHLYTAPDADLLMLYDYRDLSPGAELNRGLERYAEIDVIAWSMGVWAFSQWDAMQCPTISRAVAVNGTCHPIHRRYGIPPRVYQTTLDRFSQQVRDTFFTRMCGAGRNSEQFEQHPPTRPLEEQQQELAAIQRQALHVRPNATCFDYALISMNDVIIPTQHQINFWKARTRHALIDAPHFPFFLWNSWEDILRHASTH